MRVEQNPKWHRGRYSASGVPQPRGAESQCVCPCRGLESCQFLSRTLLHPMPSPPGAEYELNGNKSSMRGWGERASREVGKGKLPSRPCSRAVPVSNVLLSQSSPTPRPYCPPPATSCQCFTSVSLPAPHGPQELSPWLLCNSWTGSQDLMDIPAPSQ